MKRSPGPVISVVLLLGLGVVVYFTEFRGADARRKAEEGKDKVQRVERGDLKSLRIQNEKGTVRLQKAGDAWTITEPLAVSADKDAVDGLLASLEMARVERRIGAESNLKDYHLDPPAASITLEGAASGSSQTVDVGDTNAIGGTYFARLPGGKEVAVVSASLGDAAKKDVFVLRDKTVLAFDPWKVKRLAIERGKEKILLLKPEDGWKVQEPIEAPADGPAVTDLLTAVERLRATAFAADKPGEADLKTYGLDAPAARLTLLQDGWDVEKSIQFGKEGAGGRFVRTVGRDPVIVVPNDVWAKINTSLNDLRRKDLLGVSQYRVESITAAREGKPALVLARQKDKTWKASGLAAGTVKDETVDGFLRALGELKAASFEDAPSEAERSALAQRPALDVTLQQEADAPGGSSRSQHFVVGPPDTKGMVRVRDLAWRPIAVAAAATLEKAGSQLDAIVKEASEPPKPAPAAAVAPAAPGAAPAPATPPND